MTPIGTLASDFLPILNDYYTEITALVIGYYFIFFHYFLKAVKDINSILPKFP
jgi:predicted secreted protein